MINRRLVTAISLLCLISFTWTPVQSEPELPPDEFWEQWQGFDGVNATRNLENLTELCKGGQIPFLHIMEFMNNVIQHDGLYDILYIYTYKENIHLCTFCEQALKSLGLLAEPIKATNQKLYGKPLFTVALDVEVSKMVDSIPLEQLPLITYMNNDTMRVYGEDDYTLIALKEWIEEEVKLELSAGQAFDYRKIFIQIAATTFALVFGYLSREAAARVFLSRGFVALLVVIWCIVLMSGFMISMITKAPLVISYDDTWTSIYPNHMRQIFGEVFIVGGLCK